MIAPSNHPLEPIRLDELHAAGILDSPLSPQMERITRLATLSLGAPICAVSLIDAQRQWFCSIQGLDVAETERSVSFCGHTILTPGIMEIPDALDDPRFADNPLVIGEPYIRFYAGRPLLGLSELPIGTLCVIDRRPRTLNDAERAILDELGAMAQAEIRKIQAGRGDLVARTHSQRSEASADPLTRLCDRAAMVRILAGVLRDHEHDGRPAVCAIYQIDGFDRIVAEFGEACAHAVIRESGRRTLASCHENETIGIFGDGAFLGVLAPIACTTAALDAVERLRAQFADVRVGSSDAVRQVRVLAGAALGTIGTSTVTDMLIGAERALREASCDQPAAIVRCNRLAA